MPDLVTGLQNAGFSQDEVQAHLTQQRDQLRTAGFNDGEIDDHFGMPKVPDALPPSYISRIAQGIKYAREVTQLPGTTSGVMNEAVDNTIATVKGVVQNLLPTSLGGTREPSKEGTAEGLETTAKALASIPAIPFAPIVGALHSLAGKPLV